LAQGRRLFGLLCQQLIVNEALNTRNWIALMYQPPGFPGWLGDGGAANSAL
jgi:hypothetical protein